MLVTDVWMAFVRRKGPFIVCFQFVQSISKAGRRGVNVLCMNKDKGISLTAGEGWDQDFPPGLLGLRAKNLTRLWQDRANPLETTQMRQRQALKCSGLSSAGCSRWDWW